MNRGRGDPEKGPKGTTARSRGVTRRGLMLGTRSGHDVRRKKGLIQYCHFFAAASRPKRAMTAIRCRDGETPSWPASNVRKRTMYRTLDI